jgi:hypothetical protein
MIARLRLLTYFLMSLLKSRRRLEAEVVVLRHQLNVLRRAAPSNLRLTVADRLIVIWLYCIFPSLIKAVAIVKPATVLRWHRGDILTLCDASDTRKPGRGGRALADQIKAVAGVRNQRYLQLAMARVPQIWGM